MESGLEDRNNLSPSGRRHDAAARFVSMESGLEDRNNLPQERHAKERDWSQWSPA